MLEGGSQQAPSIVLGTHTNLQRLLGIAGGRRFKGESFPGTHGSRRYGEAEPPIPSSKDEHPRTGAEKRSVDAMEHPGCFPSPAPGQCNTAPPANIAFGV